MKDNELNKLAHEALGRCWHEMDKTQLYPQCKKCRVTSGNQAGILPIYPDYVNDLNAAFELQALAIEADAEMYETVLDNTSTEEYGYALMTADARTRVIAALRVLGKI